MEKYDIFISYRRDGGEQSAKAVHDKLKDLGYKVFLDVEALRSGEFNAKLYSVIEQCRDVLVILSPGALDRCENDDDWVRLEVAHALRCKKNIVPILLRGFQFPETLPGDIDKLRFQNGVSASVEFFDAFVAKLQGFLKSRATFTQRVRGSLSWRKALIAVACCAAVGLAAWAATVLIGQATHATGAFPATQKEKNQVKELLYNVELNMTVADNMLYDLGNALDACQDSLDDPGANPTSMLTTKLDHCRQALQSESQNAQALPQNLIDALSTTKISVADAAALASTPQMILHSYKDSLDAVAYVMDPEHPFDAATRRKALDIYRNLLDDDAGIIFLSTCELLLPVDESALGDYRSQFLPALKVLSGKLPLWSRDETSLKSQQDGLKENEKQLMGDLATIVGDLDKDFLSEKEALIAMLVADGMTDVQARQYVENMLAKTQALENDKQKLDELNQKLQQQQDEIRKKFAPQDSDTSGTLWNKSMRLLALGMPNESTDCLQHFMLKMKDEDPNALVYVPQAIKLIQQIGKTGIDYGVIVTGYVDKPHSVLKVGDIIVALNGSPVKTNDEIAAQKKAVGDDKGYTVSVLRDDGTGTLKLMDLQIPAGEPKFYYLALEEQGRD